MPITFRRFAGHLAEIELWPVAFFIIASMVWPGLLPIALGVAGSFWVVRWIATGRLSVRTPVDWAVGLLCITILVTLVTTALPEITRVQVLRLLSGIALFYTIVNWAGTPKRLKILLFGVCLAGLALAISAPFSVQWAVGKIPFISQVLYENFVVRVADAIHPNVLAGSLILLLPLVLSWLLFDWGEMGIPLRVMLSVSCLAMLAALILSESRGAWMAFAVVLALLIILRWPRSWILIVVIGLAITYGIYQFGVSRFLDIFASGTTLGGFDGRLEIWSRALYMIQDYPFTGVGMGSFGKVADAIYPFYQFTQGSIPHAHNLYLQMALDLGIPGLIAWLGILGTVVARSWTVFRQGKRADSGFFTGLGAGLLGSQVALVFHGLFDAVTWGWYVPRRLYGGYGAS